MAINALYYENSVPQGTGLLEITGSEGASGLFVPLRSTAVTGTFHGPLGGLTLTQTFRFSREAMDRPIEAIYRFPLPGDAAVTRVVATFGDETISTRLAGRHAAEKEYDEAFKSGKKAVLVTRESHEVFTLHLTGIPPETDVLVQTTFTLLARAVPAGWELRLPVTVAPRYVRGDESHPGVQANPLLSVTDPGYRISLDLRLLPASIVTVLSPGGTVSRDGEATRIRIDHAFPDRDLLLRWAVSSGHDWLSAWFAPDPDGRHTYLLALVSPPEQASSARIPREVIIVADQSGSMHGSKWKAAARSVLAFLEGLGPDELFSLCLFSNEPQWFNARGPVPATRESVAAARSFVEKTSLFGGTEIGVALEQALRKPRQAGHYSRHVLVITDGQVTDESRLFRLVEAEAARQESRRVSVISIDTAPNAHLALELARIGGGVAKFLAGSGDVEGSLRELLAAWQPPVITGVRLTVDQATIEVVDHRTLVTEGTSSVDIGDLRPETPQFICARVPSGSINPVVTLAGTDGYAIASAVAAPGGDALLASQKAFFGAGRIRNLEYLLSAGHPDADLPAALARMGYAPPGAEPSLYPENSVTGYRRYLEELIISESLRYHVPSTLTAFVGVSEKAGEVPGVTVAVPNAVPGGWEMNNLCLACYDEGLSDSTGAMMAPPSQPGIVRDNVLSNQNVFTPELKKSSPRRLPGAARSGRGLRLRGEGSCQATPSIQAIRTWTIPALDLNQGETILVDGYIVRDGRFILQISLPPEVTAAGMMIRVLLDGQEIRSCTGAALPSVSGKPILLPIDIPFSGTLRVIIRDPSGWLQGKAITVTLRPDQAGDTMQWAG